MATLSKRLTALEKKQKKSVSDDGYREEGFLRDGKPWMRYSDGWYAIELPCNGRDDPLDDISGRVDKGEAMPDGLLPEEVEAWQVSLMGKLGNDLIRRIASGELARDALSPQELDCLELVEAVRAKY